MIAFHLRQLQPSSTTSRGEGEWSYFTDVSDEAVDKTDKRLSIVFMTICRNCNGFTEKRFRAGARNAAEYSSAQLLQPQILLQFCTSARLMQLVDYLSRIHIDGLRFAETVASKGNNVAN